jgi:hypothetical protein
MAESGNQRAGKAATIDPATLFSSSRAGTNVLRNTTAQLIEKRRRQAQNGQHAEPHPLWGRALELARDFAVQHLGVGPEAEWGSGPLPSVQISMGTVIEKYIVGVAEDLVNRGFTVPAGKLSGYQLVAVRSSRDFSGRVGRARRLVKAKNLTENNRAKLLREQVAEISSEFFIDQKYVHACIKDAARASYPDLLTVFSKDGRHAMVAAELKVSGQNDVKSVDGNVDVLKEISAHLKVPSPQKRRSPVNNVVAILFAQNQQNIERRWGKATTVVNEAALGAIFGTGPLTPREYGHVREQLAQAAADQIIASKLQEDAYTGYDQNKTTVAERWKKAV